MFETEKSGKGIAQDNQYQRTLNFVLFVLNNLI